MGRYFRGRVINSDGSLGALIIRFAPPTTMTQFDPGLVRRLWLADLSLTPNIFLQVQFSGFSPSTKINFPAKIGVAECIDHEPLAREGGRGGGAPIYELYRYVPHFGVWLSSRFSLK